jgi:regulator of protease activity HflC (stomatin/prohibitin superfamily)
MITFIIILVIVFFYLVAGIRLLYQYEKGVMFTLGKFVGVKEPGLKWLAPIFQTMRKVDLRIKTAEIPRQEVMTKDNISVLVNAVVYFRVVKPEDAIIKIENFEFAVRQYTQAALRDVIGNSELDTVLTERESVAEQIEKIVDTETDEWGISIESIKIQEIELPAEMKRAIAKQAEAEREKRAVIINAEGEQMAAEKLKQAAVILSQSPVAVTLRTLQTIRDIAADPSEKIIIFAPSDIGKTVEKILGEKQPNAGP